ncbi:MAG: DUF4124 domain-containing protein [Myxococcales bacterium]|nr:DUF4124 domain-containing protein [Myxococcales bacterium]
MLLPILGLLLLAADLPAETYVWIDEQGVTHLTDDPERVPPGARALHGRAEREALWEGPLGPVEQRAPADGPTDHAEARIQRLLRGAVADLERGENARAAVALEGVLSRQPGRPEAHWYLALLDRHRGRYESAEVHLRAFLASAGEDLEPWRASARRRLAALEDERRLADAEVAEREAEWIELEGRHFRVYYDSDLGRASDGYAPTVLRYLEEARGSVGARLGAFPAERMGIVFYGRAAYQRAHGHRFSFQTVGFYDGRIHVVSAAHPAGELRALLFHEYAHAVFREHTGGDRPYWLNEGLAELAERESRQQPGLTRSERSLLRLRMDAGEWIPLRRLVPSFSGLDDEGARMAYLEAAAAAAWIEAHTDRAQRAQLLAEIGTGQELDRSLEALLGLDTDALDRAVQASIRSEFPDAVRRDAVPGGR